MSETYMLVDCDGDPSVFRGSESEAWARASELNERGGPFSPWTVAKLVPVPRPVPPRPTMQWDGDTWIVVGGGTEAQAQNCGTMTRGFVAKLSELFAQTDAWEREHGGAQP